MSAALGLGGWLVALAGLGAVAGLRLQRIRHLAAVARACHEVRGPLTAVRLGLELGARRAPPAPNRLRAIELELGRAALALDDLTELGVRRAVGIRPPELLQSELFDLSELVHDAVEVWRPFGQARGVELRVGGVAPRVSVRGQRLRLGQAVGNLVANAIEHGGGEVEVSLRSQAGVARLEIVDGGPGLPGPIDELTHRPARNRRQRGHGLAIVSRIVAAHGGRLAAAPSDLGARIVLELPASR